MKDTKRVTVTIPSDMDNSFIELAKKNGMSKDKFLCSILTQWMDNPNSFKTHNARGAGRHELFTEESKQQILAWREKGLTIRDIADKFNCSSGLVCKIINGSN